MNILVSLLGHACIGVSFLISFTITFTTLVL